MPAPTYYDRNRDALLATYNALDPTEVHAAWAPAETCARSGAGST